MRRIYSNKKDEGLYTNNVERMDLVGIAKYVEKANREQMNFESICNTCIRLRSKI